MSVKHPEPDGGYDGRMSRITEPLRPAEGLISRVDFGEPRRTQTFNQLIKSPPSSVRGRSRSLHFVLGTPLWGTR
jgi:hypothetical protein